MDVVQNCKDLWLSATTESEKFTAIETTIKLLKLSKLPSCEMEKVFDCVEFSFLLQLLQGENIHLSCTPLTYKSIAISALSYFSNDKAIVVGDLLCSATPELKNILNSYLMLLYNEPLISNTLDCIYNMVKCYKSRKHLLENGIISCLVKLYIGNSCGESKALEALKVILPHFKSEDCASVYSTFEFFLLLMAKEIPKSEFGSVPFAGRSPLEILCDPESKINGVHTWIIEFQNKFLQCSDLELNKEQKDIALKLASLLTKKCAIGWIGTGSKFIQLFVLRAMREACNEVETLQGCSAENIYQHTFVLGASFSIFECFISEVCSSRLWRPEWSVLEDLNISLHSASTSVIAFLCTMCDAFKSAIDIGDLVFRKVVQSAVKIVCIWLTEKSHNLCEEKYKLIPFILSVCNDCFLSAQIEALCGESQTHHEDLMQLFLIPLDRFICDDDLRTALLEQGIVSKLFQYLFYQWPVYRKDPSLEADALLCNICKIVLTIVCMDSHVVGESEVFFNFLKYLLNIVPFLPTDYENLCLKANFAALGLLITKHHYKRILSCETSFYRFLSFSVKFLWDSYQVEDSREEISFMLAREYRYNWPEIMEPWFIGMHALSTLLPLMPWITDFLLESGWPQHIIAALRRVWKKGIECNVKYAYQAFLSSLVRVSPIAAQKLIECEGIYVCKKHELNELEKLLSK